MRKNKPNRLQKIQLHIMISEAEDQMICERMKRCGYESKSEYIRRMSIDGGILVVDDAKREQCIYPLLTLSILYTRFQIPASALP